MAKIEFTLLENSYNFLNFSLHQAIEAEVNPEKWKYAILHLVQAIELILKERLRQEHPALIFRDVDKQKDTVSLEYAASRLQKISRIEFDKSDLDTVWLATNFRNQIVHYEFSIEILEIKSIYSKLIGFFQSFLLKQFKISLDSIISKEIWGKAIIIIEYVNELLKRAEERFKNESIDEKWIFECPKCHQYSFVIQDDINTCYVCGHVDQMEKCDWCEDYFYIYDLQSLHEYDDKLYCNDCYSEMQNRHRYDDEMGYYSSIDYPY
jgi:Zn finger protein HypA/HybF involved in hydrogenase expression